MATRGSASKDGRGLRYTEHIRPDPDGHLVVEGVACEALAAEHGTPLFVLSEAQIRANYREIRDAYTTRYRQGGVSILYAVKANNNLAVRRILSQEGAGGDCFGVGEIYVSLLGGADPTRLVLNGANKSDSEIDLAVQTGMQVHVETLEDVDRVQAAAAAQGRRVRAKVRIKPRMPDLAEAFGAWSTELSVDQAMQRYKWGARLEECIAIVHAALAAPNVDLIGYHCHQGRQTNTPEYFAPMMSAMVRFADRVRRETGFVGRVFNVGGGYPSRRDPTGRGEAARAASVDEFATAMVDALEQAFASFDYPAPDLELEPGRYIVENAEVLLTTVGTVKREPGRMTWVNVDASFNHLLETYTDQTYHHVVPVDRVGAETTGDVVEVVGPTCYEDVLCVDRRLPPVKRGDVLALLDVGAYAEVFSSQFNGMPRPPTLLVSGSDVHVIKERESIQDVFARQLVPAHLLS